MPNVSELIAMGYGGYAGWGDTEANADFNATGGRGKETNTGSSGSSFNPISITDFVKLEQDAYAKLQPYYLQLAKEAKGDYTRAVSILEEDYNKGTREAKADFARKKQQEELDFQNSISQLGLSNLIAQEQGISDLNKRGMAVGQMSGPGQYNALKTSEILSPLGENVSRIVTPSDEKLIGRGATELTRIQEDQKLRREAVQRATNKNIAELGVSLKKYTNPEATDRSQMGTAELAKIRGIEDQTRQAQITSENLANQMRQQATEMASNVAGYQGKEIPTSLANQYLKNAQLDFTEKGFSA